MNSKLTRVIRLDSMPLFRANFTSEGYLEDRPVLTTCGIFEYTDVNGNVRRELRLPEEVFRDESLASYKGKPIIITHDAGMITKDNVADEQIGTILSEGYRSGNDVRAEIIIHDTDDMRESGLKELSLGYTLDLDETPGEWNGEHYDAVQRNILINHLALVKEARAGDQARLNIDSRNSRTKILTGGKVMKKFRKASRADGLLSPDELQQAIEEYMNRRAAEKNNEDGDGEPEEEEKAVPAPEADVPAPEANAPAAEKPEEKKDDAEENRTKAEQPKEASDSPGAPVVPGTDAPLDEKIAYANDCRNTDAEIDNGLLYNIIDTLLAERDFNNAVKGEENKDAEGEELAEVPEEDDTPEEIPGDRNEDSDDNAIPFTNEKENEADNARFISQTAADDEEEPAGEIPDEEFESLKEDDDEAPIPFKTAAEAFAEDKNVRSDDIESIIQARLNVALVGRSMNLDGLEKLPVLEAKKKIIARIRPDMRLDGKSEDYVNGVYALAVNEIRKKRNSGTEKQKERMFNKVRNRNYDSNDSGDISSRTAREKMIERQMNKQNKEDK